MTKYILFLAGVLLVPTKAQAILCGGAFYGCTCPSGYTVTCQSDLGGGANGNTGAFCVSGFSHANCGEGNGGVFQGNVNNMQPGTTGGGTPPVKPVKGAKKHVPKDTKTAK